MNEESGYIHLVPKGVWDQKRSGKKLKLTNRKILSETHF